MSTTNPWHLSDHLAARLPVLVAVLLAVPSEARADEPVPATSIGSATSASADPSRDLATTKSEGPYGTRGESALHMDAGLGASSLGLHAGASLVVRHKLLEVGAALDTSTTLVNGDVGGGLLVGVAIPDGVRRYHLLFEGGAHQETRGAGFLSDDPGAITVIPHLGPRIGIDWALGKKQLSGTFGIYLHARMPLASSTKNYTYTETSESWFSGQTSTSEMKGTADFGKVPDLGLSLRFGFDLAAR